MMYVNLMTVKLKFTQIQVNKDGRGYVMKKVSPGFAGLCMCVVCLCVYDYVENTSGSYFSVAPCTYYTGVRVSERSCSMLYNSYGYYQNYVCYVHSVSKNGHALLCLITLANVDQF